MKKSPLFLLMMFALCRAALAADPVAPMADLEPQPGGRPASQAAPGSPAGTGLDDFGFAQSSAQSPGPADVTARDDEYRSAAQPTPALEGF